MMSSGLLNGVMVPVSQSNGLPPERKCLSSLKTTSLCTSLLQVQTQTHTRMNLSEPVSMEFVVCVTEKFLGNQMLSYGQNLSLSFRVDRRDTRLSAEDLVLEGANLRLAIPLIAQGNAYPNENMQRYVFR